MRLHLDIALGLVLCEARRRRWEAMAKLYGDEQSPQAAFARFMWWRCERNLYAMRLLAGELVRSGSRHP